MRLNKIWSELNEGRDQDLSALLETGRIQKLSSHSPLQKIKQNLLINIMMGILVCLVYIFIILHFPIWQVQLAMIIVMLFSFWALFTAWQHYRNMESVLTPDNSVLAELKRQVAAITEWMTTQQRVALFIYPVSAAGGFMLGGVEGSGKPVSELMTKPVIWIALLIAIAILVPACHFLTKWMFRFSFGKHLELLRANIKALEEEK